MTHDELLAKIDYTVAIYEGLSVLDIRVLTAYLKALCAVVELHNPVQGRSDITTYDYIGCDSCVEWSHDGNMNLKYPCPTIQAIEKELK
jgi:hypothetical protein